MGEWQWMHHDWRQAPQVRFDPFAWSDVLLRCDAPAMVYTWLLAPTVILGMRDARLPHLSEGVALLAAQGWQTVVRHFGGLAVVADDGVLNVTFVCDNRKRQWSVDAAYQWVTERLQAALPEAAGRIVAQEVPQSYCPGSYDLTIDGRKFAGVAQRRFKDAISISLYLSVTGNQQARGQLIRDFYEVSGAEAPAFPNVEPAVMANLSELVPSVGTIELLCERLRASVQATVSWQPNSAEQALQQQFCDKMRVRQPLLLQG